MIKVTDQEFIAALSKSSEPIRNLMYSDLLFAEVDKFLKAHSSEAQAGETLLPIGYYLLELRTQEETLEGLHDLKVPDVFALLKTIEDLKVSIVVSDDRDPEMPSPLIEPTLSFEIAEAEKSLESLQGIRTMAADMQAVEPAAQTEQVHSSSQEEILTPKAAFGGQQRWDTEA